MYHSRKLPHIIGTQSFLGDEFVGLENLSETEDLEVSESSDESEDELDVEGPVQNPDSVQAEEPKSNPNGNTNGNPNGNMYPDNPDADADSEFSDDEESVMQPPPKLTKQKVFSDLSNDENAEDQDIKSDIIDPDNFEHLEKTPGKNDFLSELSSKIQVGARESPKLDKSSPKLVQNSPKLSKSIPKVTAKNSPKTEKMAKNIVTKDNSKISTNSKSQSKNVKKATVKTTMNQKPGKSLFESDSDSDDLFSGRKSEKTAVQKPILSNEKKSLFDDLSDEEDENPVLPVVPEKVHDEHPVQIQKPDKLVFEDSSSDDLEDLFVKKTEKKSASEKTEKVTGGSSIENIIAANIKRSKIFDSSPESESDESDGESKEEQDKPVLNPDDETDGFLADKAKKLTSLVTSKIGNPKKNQRQSLNPDDFVEVPKPDFSIAEKSEKSELSASSEPPLDFTVETEPENPVLLSSVTKNRANLGNRKRRPPTRQKLKTSTDPDEVFKDSNHMVDNPDSSAVPPEKLEIIESDEKQEIIKKSLIPKQGNALLINELRVKLKPSQKTDNAQEKIPEPKVLNVESKSGNLIDNISGESGFGQKLGKSEKNEPSRSGITGSSDPVTAKCGNSEKSEKAEPAKSELSEPSDQIGTESGLSGLASKEDSKEEKPVLLEDSDSDSDFLFKPPPITDQIKKKSDNLFAGFSSSDDDDLFTSTTTKSAKNAENQAKKSGGLFDDDSDSDLDDLFSGKM